MVTMGWLLGVVLFVSMVNCVMKSDFSEERYYYLDDLETLMENQDIKPVVIEGGFTHGFLKKWGRRALIINRLLLTWFFGFYLSDDLPEMRRLYDKYGGLYISKRRVKSDFLAYLVNKTFSIESPIIYEQECLGSLVMFETAVFHYLDLNSEFALRFMEWKKPTKITSSLTLSALTGPFFILLCGFLLSSAILAIEAASFFVMMFILKSKQTPRRVMFYD